MFRRLALDTVFVGFSLPTRTSSLSGSDGSITHYHESLSERRRKKIVQQIVIVIVIAMIVVVVVVKKFISIIIIQFDILFSILAVFV